LGRTPRIAILVLAVGLVAVAGVLLIGVTWSDRAEAICREDQPATEGGVSVRWEWAEFAYVCDYGSPAEQPRRVGIIDAFHGDEARRHGPR
jgi:hypothetical protein